MRHIPKWAVVVVMGFTCVITAYVFGSEQFRHHDLTKTMDEAANVAATQSLDKSVRVDEGTVNITKSTFENIFKEQMRKKSMKADIKSVHFDYLDGKNDSTKAIRVTIVDNQGSSCTITYVADLKQ